MNIYFENGTWVVESIAIEEEKVWTKSVFDSKLENRLGFSWGRSEGTEQKIEASYTVINGVSIPSTFVEIRYMEGNESSRSTYRLVSSEMNPFFPTQDFTITSFNLPDGTRMVDFRDTELPKFGQRPSFDFSNFSEKREEYSRHYFETTKMYSDGAWLNIDEYNAKVPD